VVVLLFVLLAFDDPLCGLQYLYPFKLYYIIISITQATFISMLLFFWLIVVHSISSVRLFS